MGCIAMSLMLHPAATTKVKAVRIVPAMVFGLAFAPYVLADFPRPDEIQDWHWSFISSIICAGGVYAAIAKLPKSASAKVEYLQTLLEAFLGRRPTVGKGRQDDDT
jgi:Na+(H+)/acetate symporter ActP